MRTLAPLGLLLALLGSPPVPAQDAAGKARLTVTLPRADARVTIDGTPMRATGAVRRFETPPVLAPGVEYTYVVRAVWEPNNYTTITRTREVRFRAGADVAADLSKDDGTDRAVVRFVPTPPEVVAKMIELGKVGPDDVAFEPGCGDGRIVAAAVKAGAKRGVGIDRDPKRIAEANATARKVGVADKVEVRQGDALDIKDLGDATVVFLYMGDEFDALIRPLLWAQLRVGARVVSHRFLMGDWKPDRTETMTGEDGDEYLLHVWTVTADVKKRAGEKK